MIPDTARDADRGVNLQGVLGMVLADSVSAEVNAFGTKISRTSGGKDAINGAGLDLTLGTPAPGNPFFLIGAGAAPTGARGRQEDFHLRRARGRRVLPFSFAGELCASKGATA